MEKSKVYFPNLNGLRFIAALLVIIHHIEQRKSLLGIDSLIKNHFVDVIGKLGVVLFFVLSGFLITYLLLIEKKETNNISIKKFYFRRVLRIWPLYFLIIFIALAILPHIDFFQVTKLTKVPVYQNILLKICLYIFFLPNVVANVAGKVPYATHLWSIGAEEQFYLVWPGLLKYIKIKTIILLCIIIAGYFFLNLFLESNYSYFIPNKYVFIRFLRLCNINCMAIGGIFAYLKFSESKLLKIILNNYLFYATLIVTCILIANGFKPKYLYYDLYSILFGIIILNFAVNTSIKISIENKLLTYLGTISYGLYMFHPIAIAISLGILVKLNLLTNLFLYPLTVIITIIIAGLSYKYFERFFLKFKSKYSVIKSGNV